LADLIVIVVVIERVLTATSRLLGVVDPITAVLLTLGWTSTAAQRIIAWRKGAAPLFQHGQFASDLRSKPVTVIALGVTPWVLLPPVQQLFQHASVLTPLAFPLWLRATGTVLMLCGVFRPFWQARSRDPHRGSATMATPAGVATLTAGALAHAMGVFLLSASPLIGVLVGTWIVISCCVDRWQVHPMAAAVMA